MERMKLIGGEMGRLAGRCKLFATSGIIEQFQYRGGRMRRLMIALAALLAVALILSVIGYGYTQDDEEEPEGDAAAGCCVCASAYASTDDEDLNVIRSFRDDYLMTNPVGRGVAALYYEVFSPPVARFINDNPSLKPVARAALMPVVALSDVAVDTTLAEKLAILGALALASVAVVVWVKKRRGKGLQNS